MSRRNMMCQPCDAGDHNGCRDPLCGCCGDYSVPDPPLMAGDDEMGREEDARLAAQFGDWPEASRR